ncbi:MAG: HesA/MoeB/ThiF family protein [Desulfobacteraceae bacterium]|nr:HesA/MoeB/ThiF family protein [Desulfobacteraceae bacterium]
MALLDSGRYSRQIKLPQIGPGGQEKLAKARVLIAGAGGLGSLSSLYLAAAGVGHLIIADHDHVELSNLNRQLLYCEANLGKPKVASASHRLGQLNSTIKVTQAQVKIDRKSIDNLLKGVDLVVDGCDNYPTRQVINRACLRHNLPWVFGGVQGFDGMISSFVPGSSPCFECIIQDPDKPKTFKPETIKPKTIKPDTQIPDNGILGATAGMIASIQAMEAVKLLLNIGTPLTNRLIRISGLDMRITTAVLTPNPECRACAPSSQNKDKKHDHPV